MKLGKRSSSSLFPCSSRGKICKKKIHHTNIMGEISEKINLHCIRGKNVELL